MTATKNEKLPTHISRTANGKYRVRLMVDGRTSTLTTETLEAAKDALAKLQFDNRILGVNYANYTLDEFFPIFLQSKAHTTIRTRQNIEERYNRISPLIGSIPLKKLTPLTIQSALNQLAGKGMSKTTVSDTRTLLKDMMQAAVEDRLIVFNPVTKRVKANGTEPRENLIMTRKQQSEFYGLALFTTCGESLIFACETGLRYGELVGLQFDDIDFETRTIRVKHNLEIDSKTRQWRDKPPKSKASRRIIPLTDTAYSILLYRYKCWNDTSIKRPKQFANNVFVNQNGKPIEDSNYNRTLRMIKADMKTLTDEDKAKKFSMHTLRHTFATRCAEAGVSVKYLQTIMGHANVNITLQIYTHITQLQIDEEFEKFANAQPKILDLKRQGLPEQQAIPFLDEVNPVADYLPLLPQMILE